MHQANLEAATKKIYEDSQMKKIGQPLMGDKRYVAIFSGPDHVPYPLEGKLSFKDDVWPYQDRDVEVTFTVRVPLAVVITGQAAISAYITQQYLPDDVSMLNFRLRSIGSTFDDFTDEVSGSVHLQVLCMLKGPVAGS